MSLGDTLFVDRDGREYHLLFDHEGMIAAEDVASRNGANLGFKDVVVGSAAGRLGCLRALVYGALRAHHPEVTVAEATGMVEREGKPLGKALFEAMANAAPPPAKGKAANPPKAASGTGTRSSPPGAKRASTRKASSTRPRAASRPR